jgi:activator of 2-hydroxyglutaryl-CoA dehydratase/predicted nucleotide-binding protein (sugar kinase/HSP70/actin superfamily)
MDPSASVTRTTADTLLLGIDVGSTTAKCVVVDPRTLAILWQRYERHETRQAEKVAEMLADIEAAFPDAGRARFRAFITGSGAGPLAEPVGARFVQEVNAVTLAVERLHPDVNSVIELGGQDAKIILFKVNPETGARQVITSMNDKCASGTGATIDKCLLKVGMPPGETGKIRFDPARLHHVAAKCGVFAETDIVNLIKSGVPAVEVLNSLADAIVMQNLSVLTRGNTLTAKVLLLGGPNAYLPFLQECWRLRIPETWAERGYRTPAVPPAELILVPENAQYYAAYGAVVFGVLDAKEQVAYRGLAPLAEFIRHGRKARLGAIAAPPLLKPGEDLETFRRRYQPPVFSPPGFEPGTRLRGYIGLDGGSTSSKAVLLDERGEILTKEYLLSRGNPIQDAKEILARIKQFATDRQCTLEVLGVGATGYAADVLEKAMRCDANIVETVAHMMSAKRYCGEDIDVICDVGGQDIKVLFMQDGTVRNFRLSNQCSAGNGMLLQAMAHQFGVDIKQYADVAFRAELAPRFSYGCAVFLDTDRVNFQKEGFTREELFAGLAQVLPKNIWQYVVQIPRMSELGRKFVLQGGTQYNLAAVKAQVDYIRARAPGAEVMVHPHCGEAGAIGAALEASRVVRRHGRSTFIGLEAAIGLQYTTRTDETTRCTFCENNCSRTFIDARMPDEQVTRYIAGFSCEKGTVESKEAVVALHKERQRLKVQYPNLVDYETHLVFRHFTPPAGLPEAGTMIDDVRVTRAWFGRGGVRRRPVRRPFARSSPETHARRRHIRVGLPRVLNLYTVAPFIRTYLETLGIESRNVVFSDQTSEELWLAGGRYGSIDPCYPSKVALAHVHHLLHVQHARKPLDYVWFPCVTHVPGFVTHTIASTACPVVAGTPKVAAAAFTKEKDFFAQAGVEFVDEALNFAEAELLAYQLYETWGARLGITEDENDFACEQGFEAMRLCDEELQQRGLEVLTRAEQDNSVVLLLLGRPYHDDPGLNHDILEEFQSLGYPLLSIRSLPKDPAYLERFFRADLERGLIADVFDVRDVWPENFSANSVQKVWAAKFAARHPNVAALDLSSFKCGQDAPAYGIIDRIIGESKTPYSALHDIDANKPGGSIKIRVKTYAYALERYRERLADLAAAHTELERAVQAKRHELLARRQVLRERRARPPEPGAGNALEGAYREYLQEARADAGDLRSRGHTAAVTFHRDPPPRAACEAAPAPDEEARRPAPPRSR